MPLNLKGITKGVERNADKLATLFGYYSSVKTAQPTWGLTEMFTEPLNNIISGKIPDLEKIKWRLLESDYVSPTFKNGLLLLIGSELAKGIVPSKWTKLGSSVGQGLATGAIIASVALGQSPAGEPHSIGSQSYGSSGNSPSWGYNS